MKNSNWIVLSLVLALGGCGDDDGGGGGGGNTGGEPGASGGSSTGGGASGGTTGSTGGSSTGGMGGQGGGFGNEDCPASAPTEGDECDVEAGACPYEETSCWCQAFGPDEGTWQCFGGGDGECPDDEPATGSCSGGDFCSHADGLCFCQNDSWVCSGD